MPFPFIFDDEQAAAGRSSGPSSQHQGFEPWEPFKERLYVVILKTFKLLFCDNLDILQQFLTRNKV